MWALVVLLVLMIPLIAVISDSPVGRALAKRLERDGGGVDSGAAKRIADLEREVDRLASQVERLEEGTRFLERLLEERPGERRDRLEPGDSGR